jgi:acetyltransferase-like isoleucine patch superfamily enzyme
MRNIFQAFTVKILKNFFLMESQKAYEKWRRHLPANEYVSDRWERAKAMNFGQGTSIYNNSYVFGEVKVGANTWIGPFTILDGSGSLTIGDNCSISAGVQIYTHDTVEWALTGGKKQAQYAAVSIGDNCYIGPNAIITKGVRIGNGCTIGANSFVNNHVDDGASVWGSPAKSGVRAKESARQNI